MKHTLKVTLALAAFFFLAQVVGLLIVNQYIDHKKTVEAKEIIYKPLPYSLERPQVENQSTSFMYVIITILVGTGLLLLIAKTHKPFFWKILFFISISITLSVALAAFINIAAAAVIAVIISFLRLNRPNMLIHNISEVFIYGGLATIMVNIFNLFAAFMLLIFISIYDYIAVFRTKHMIQLAEFQSEAKVFAGLYIPYSRGKVSAGQELKAEPVRPKSRDSTGKVPSKGSVAILGGGDIGFTLIFASVVMKDLMLHNAIWLGFLKTLIIPVFVTIALFILLMKGRQSKFYPAMPVLSLGCFIGYLVVWLI